MTQRDPLFSVADKVILVAGGAGGFGSAIVGALAERGARVTVADIDVDRARRVAADCAEGTPVGVRELDIRDEEAVAAAVEEIVRRQERLDGVINAAGIFRLAPITEMSIRDFRDSMENNLTGAFVLTRAAARAMGADGGSILHFASVSSLVANTAYAAYASSKAALSHMVRVAARELSPRGITVNAIGPALTETPLTAAHLADPDFRANAIAHIPMGRLGLPEDVLGLAIMLMAPGGVFITGQTVYADGGRTLV